MPEYTVSLSASTLPEAIADTGLDITAPGLLGQLTYSSHGDVDTTRSGRADAPDPKPDGLAEAGLVPRHVLAIDATIEGGPSLGVVRAVVESPPDEIRLDISDGKSPVLFAVQRDGDDVLSLHFPEPAEARPPQRAATASKSIVIRLRPTSQRSDGTRLLGSKLIKAVIWFVVRRAAEPVLAAGEFAAVKWWENKWRSFQGFHGGDPGTFLAAAPVAADPGRLAQLAGKKSLVFIHGTTSSTRVAFGEMAHHELAANELWRRYEGRVIGFNHHTLTKGVAENAVDFLDALGQAGAGRSYSFDVIVHSRGGLVARAVSDLTDADLTRLAGRAPAAGRPAVTFERVVFVGTPNNGTALADPKNLPTALNWLANIAEAFGSTGVPMALGAIFSIAAMIGEAGLKTLPGLADQAVDAEERTGALLQALNACRLKPSACFGIEADFVPSGRLLAAIEAFAIKKAFRDATNDLVVPTASVSRFGGQSFPGPSVKRFTPSDKLQVYHSSFFNQTQTWDHLLRVLP